MKPDVDHGWRIDQGDLPLGEDLDLESLKKCYPALEAALSEALAIGEDLLCLSPETKKTLQEAVQEEAAKPVLRTDSGD